MPGTLIIGYGNLLRGDDAIGCCAARELERYYHDSGEVRVIAAHQLTPEMADDIAASQFVLFMDASCGEDPGTIRVTKLSPDSTPNGFTHQLNPATLLSAVDQALRRRARRGEHYFGGMVV